MRKLIVVVLFIVALSMSFSSQASAAYMGVVTGRWPSLNMTYAFDQSCQLPYRRAAIDFGIQAWQRWLPASTWAETSFNAAWLRMLCFEDGLIPGSGNTMASVLAYPAGPFNTTSWLWTFAYAVVEFGNYTWVGDDSEIITTHEIGHAFGLIDGTGGLMSQGDWQTAPYDPLLGIPVPNQWQIDAISEVYGVPTHTLDAVSRTTTQTTETEATVTTVVVVIETKTETAQEVTITVTTETTVTDVPEFPLPLLIMLVALTVASIVVRGKKRNANCRS